MDMTIGQVIEFVNKKKTAIPVQKTYPLEKKKHQEELKSYEDLKNKDFENEIKLRKFYATGFFWLICISSLIVYIFLILIGTNCLRFELPVTLEIVPLVFINIISIVLIITRYLFRNRSN